MGNLLRSYLGLDKEPEPEPEKKTEEKPKPDPKLERTSKFTRPKKGKKGSKRYQPKEVEERGD